MKKPRNEAAESVRWSVYMMGTTATCAGSVEARDATEALDTAITQREISPRDRLRVGVARE
jgi:hypothetical protein